MNPGGKKKKRGKRERHNSDRARFYATGINIGVSSGSFLENARAAQPLAAWKRSEIHLATETQELSGVARHDNGPQRQRRERGEERRGREAGWTGYRPLALPLILISQTRNGR